MLRTKAQSPIGSAEQQRALFNSPAGKMSGTVAQLGWQLQPFFREQNSASAIALARSSAIRKPGGPQC
jgi:hypothetical protein